MAVKTKKSSIKTAPKGRTPAINVERIGCIYQGWSGIWNTIKWILIRNPFKEFKKAPNAPDEVFG